MYKYSRQAQNKFFDFSTYAFLFAWFESRPEARAFSQEKFADNENSTYPERMNSEVGQLGTEAEHKLLEHQPCDN